MTNPSVPDPFYRAFEDKHRGSRELIKERLRVYLAFIAPLAGLYPALPVLDVGCGRGEWLELLGEHRIPAQGVDTDEGMLSACRERGLSVVHTDAIDHLNGLPGHSLMAVTGFHIAEHLPFAVLQALFAQAQRVLVPGGLLILETPNPENLLVGASNFYIDPTHQRPLPSQLLVFLAEHQGFAPVKHLRLQEERRLAENGVASLYDVLANASPDHAIVAQVSFANPPSRALDPHFNRQLVQAFEVDYGVSLATLSSRYDQHWQQQTDAQLQAIQVAQHKAEEALAQTQYINTHVQQLSTQGQQLGSQVQQLSTQGQQLGSQVQQLSTQGQQLSAEVQQLAAQLNAVHASHSWRITKPLRWLTRLFRGESGRG